jgi:tripartite-type tricarboxylate transporter receptor subunit TctC
MNFSSVDAGTATHLSAERFRVSAGLDMVHIPFRGRAEAMSEVIAGRIDFFLGPVGIVLPHVREGILVALVANGVKRSASLPDVPRTREAGFLDAEFRTWFGVFLPVKTPQAIIDKLHDETAKALQTPKLAEKLAELGVDPMVMTAVEFDAFIQREVAANAELVKAAGISPN